MSSNDGLISSRSQHDVPQTADRFRVAAEHAGLTIFAQVDHGQNASEVGLPLPPTLLLIFGGPRGGTPLMQINQAAGIDLPFKALVWEDEHGVTWLTCNDPQWVAERHDLGEAARPAIAAAAAILDKLIAAATA